MSVRAKRRNTAAAIALTAGITAGATLLLSACGPTDGVADGSTGGATPSATSSAGGNDNGTDSGSGNAKPLASSKQIAAAPPLNGTAHNGLTISDGTRYVVMNGTRVDFGTQVRDLAWSPDGRKAAFVDSAGDLVVAAPNGSGRVIVAANPGHQTWSHPTWQVRPYDKANQVPAANNLIFAIRPNGGATKLYSVPATAHKGKPKVISLNREFDPNVKPLPQTANIWPNAGGKYGSAVYANSGNGEVYIRDDYLRQQGFALTKGSEPAMSPTASEDIVFVRSVGGHDHLFVEHATNKGPVYKDLTPHATTDYTEPAWSPNGKTIAARTSAGIVTLPANGSAAPVKVSGYKGLPAYRKA